MIQQQGTRQFAPAGIPRAAIAMLAVAIAVVSVASATVVAIQTGSHAGPGIQARVPAEVPPFGTELYGEHGRAAVQAAAAAAAAGAGSELFGEHGHDATGAAIAAATAVSLPRLAATNVADFGFLPIVGGRNVSARRVPLLVQAPTHLAPVASLTGLGPGLPADAYLRSVPAPAPGAPIDAIRTWQGTAVSTPVSTPVSPKRSDSFAVNHGQ